ncbi:MAG: VOC family protein [Erysipelotrichaceae bacterium]|nr:VOC family protein [Erysipelotrichaceae bacterium]
MKFKIAHCNINITNPEVSLRFYEEALGLKEYRRVIDPNGNFLLIYLVDESGDFLLELTWLKDHPQKYDLGENESHIAFVTKDFEEAERKHTAMDIICYRNEAMGIYFIEDPDGYWLEILPER